MIDRDQLEFNEEPNSVTSKREFAEGLVKEAIKKQPFDIVPAHWSVAQAAGGIITLLSNMDNGCDYEKDEEEEPRLAVLNPVRASRRVEANYVYDALELVRRANEEPNVPNSVKGYLEQAIELLELS